MKKAKTIWRDTVRDKHWRIWRDTVTACCTRRRDWRRARSGRGPSFKGPKPSRLLMPLTATLFKCVQTCFETCSNVFKAVQTCSNVFKCVQTCSKVRSPPGCRCRWLQGDAETEIVAFSLVVPSNVLLQVYNTHWCHTFLSPACQNLQINMSQEINLSFDKIADL